MSQQRRVVHYSGEVQGVGFRYTAARLAGSFDVTGYVKNLHDGRVEVVIEGPPEQLDAFCQALRDRLAGYIADADQRVSPATGEFASFNIRF